MLMNCFIIALILRFYIRVLISSMRLFFGHNFSLNLARNKFLVSIKRRWLNASYVKILNDLNKFFYPKGVRKKKVLKNPIDDNPFKKAVISKIVIQRNYPWCPFVRKTYFVCFTTIEILIDNFYLPTDHFISKT